MRRDEQHLAEIKATLYALPPEEFTAARNAAAKQATGPLAQAIKALRRPTLSAWLVNLLAAHRPDELAELLTLGERLREAQRDLKGPTMRELSARRQAVTTSLLALARDLAAEHGKTIRDDTAWEAETTLRAALADPDVADQVRTGTLVRPADYNGIGLPTGEVPVEPAEQAAAEPGKRGRAKLRVILGGRSAERTAKRAAEPAEPERAAAEARAAAEQALAETQRQLEEATEAEKQATRRLGEIAAALDELRERERQLRADQAEADRDRRRATRRRMSAERAVAEAKRRLRTR